jgi:EAL domain-containing protein (putative c-di-GMP-specific phosphodiesterase class I)
MLRNADLAMYDAKEDGRDRVRFYEPSMRLSTLERLRLTTDLKQAIQNGEIVAYYQPTVRLSDQRLLGFEALARWHHPEKGLLLPDDFIPLAEDSGVIQALGNLVLTEACRQAKAWQDAYPSMHDIKMAVNVSSKQVREGLVEVVKDALDASGLSPHCLVLEVTESVLISDHERAFDLLARVKALGVSVALDDFGTGYSSLSYLKRFPIDILKIDRSFIDSVDQDDRDKLLVQTIIDLGHTLNLEIVAEGIERKQQLSKLVTLNCDFGQGYLFAKPLDVAAANELLEANERPQAKAPRKAPVAA